MGRHATVRSSPADGQTQCRFEKAPAPRISLTMTQGLVAPLPDFGGTPSMCVVVSNKEKPMDTLRLV
jgi:hypothetical protein